LVPNAGTRWLLEDALLGHDLALLVVRLGVVRDELLLKLGEGTERLLLCLAVRAVKDRARSGLARTFRHPRLVCTGASLRTRIVLRARASIHATSHSVYLSDLTRSFRGFRRFSFRTLIAHLSVRRERVLDRQPATVSTRAREKRRALPSRPAARDSPALNAL